MGFCFPVTKERGATARQAWASARPPSREQDLELHQRMQACVEVLDHHMCHQIALDMNLPYPLVRPLPSSKILAALAGTCLCGNSDVERCG